MPSRYDGRRMGINRMPQYRDLFDERHVKFIKQYFTPTLKFPTVDEMMTINQIGHVWSLGDRFFKLAYKHYGNSTLWWIIAWYNQTPTESHLEIGDIIQIPVPMEGALRVLGI